MFNTSNDIILIDLDDTLIDRGTQPDRALQQTFAHLGKSISLDDIRREDHYKLVRESGIPWKTFWDAYDLFDNRESAIANGEIRIAKGAYQFLQNFSRYQRVIVTDTPHKKAEDEVIAFNLLAHIDGMVSYPPDHSRPVKPAVDVAVLALALIKDLPRLRHIWVIGDGAQDVYLGKNLQKYLQERHDPGIVHTIHMTHREPNGCHPDFCTYPPNFSRAAQIIERHDRNMCAELETFHCEPR